MQLFMRRLGLVSAVGLAATFAACGDDNDTKTDTDTADTTDTTDTNDTTDTADSAGDSTEDTAEDTSPDTVTPTFATLTFSIDDRANKTYEAADGLAWKGSFSYDKATNTLTKNSSWSGPFVNLYDDGPAPGGHEPDGATANDNIWSIAVKVATPAADEVFEYGAISGSTDGSDGSWIWNGNGNGTVTVPAGSTGRVDATGMVVAKHGTIDLLLTIDVSNNGANLATGFQSAFTDVKVKGSAWGWNEITMVDDGTKGDATAGDKIYSFRLSDNLGKHDGLLKPGAQAQFVFVLGGVEYKAGGAPPTDGVDAAFGDGTNWVDAEIMNQAEGDKNTYVEAPNKVRVNFTIDDSVNKTYEAADGLAWKGSFSYDAATNVLTKNGSWSGPFALLYDDGPWNEGGHEPAGAVAGDHKWGISAWVANTADTFEYGAIRGSVAGADGEWIWNGNGNGTFAVTDGQITSITATGMTVAAFGTIDFRLVIDVSGNGANLATGFQSAFTDVKVKGSAWGWSEVVCKDDGTMGDKTAADGKYTFVLSENLGKHNGLLKVGDKPEFIFVLGGVEYKNGAGEGAQEGVTAYSDYSAPGADACVAATASCMMETLEVAQNKNTMITVGE